VGAETAPAKRRTSWVPGPTGWMLLCLLLPTFVYMLVVREPAPRWRAAYYSNAGLEGQALIREERDINHDWKEHNPLEGIPEDNFSVRWESCLTLDSAQSVAFQLTSDDGARLLIDGQPVVDNWGQHARRTRGADVPLRAGVHHLLVEYSELGQAASVTLAASFDGQRPRRIPPELLSFPDEGTRDPCGSGSKH
jgi:hypothetical protein